MKSRHILSVAVATALVLGITAADAKSRKRARAGTTGEGQLIDDGTCPKDQIKLVTNGGGPSGRSKREPKLSMCVPRS